MSKRLYCSYYNDPKAKRPSRTAFRLKKKERIERLAKDYAIITNKNSEPILTVPLVPQMSIDESPG